VSVALPGIRRKARELALKALYMVDIQGDQDTKTMRRFWEDQPAKSRVRLRAKELFEGILEHLEDIDRRITAASDHWRLERMSRVDRNVLRLATYEILHLPDVPPQVSIDEAVDIARRFGDNRSPDFVNGVLDRIWKEEGLGAP